MEALFIPTLSFWENGNSWYGSLGQARFFIQPQEGQLTVQLWKGPLTKEFSEILAEASFSLNPEGLDQLTAWLNQQAEELKVNSTPIVRQYGILLTNGVLFYAKRESK